MRGRGGSKGGKEEQAADEADHADSLPCAQKISREVFGRRTGCVCNAGELAEAVLSRVLGEDNICCSLLRVCQAASCAGARAREICRDRDGLDGQDAGSAVRRPGVGAFSSWRRWSGGKESERVLLLSPVLTLTSSHTIEVSRHLCIAAHHCSSLSLTVE